MDIITTAKGKAFDVDNLQANESLLSFAVKDKDINLAAKTFEDDEETSVLVINEMIEFGSYTFNSFSFSDGRFTVSLKRRNVHG